MKNTKKIFYNLEKMPLPEFLELVSKGELVVSEYNLDISNYLHDKTLNFKKEKVEEIKQRIDSRIFQNIKSSLENNPEHLKIIVKDRKQGGKEIPYNGISSLIKLLKNSPDLYKDAIKNSKKINIENLTKLIIREETYYMFLFTNVGFLNLNTVKQILLSKSNARLKDSVLQNKKPECLFDIWQGDSKESKDQYQKIIDKLKLSCSEIDKPFVTEINGKLFWFKEYGSIQYLKGFICTCIKNKWITNTSAPQYKKILSNTFNINFNPTPFKSIISNPAKDEYLKPFKNFLNNI